jgi:threonine synthase
MRFASTRDRESTVSLADAIRRGIAPDGGLYVPEAFPSFRTGDFDGAVSLAEVAERLLAPFFAGDPLATHLPAVVREAFDFPAPVRDLQAQPGLSVLELFHGPTAAFKDYGARFLAHTLVRVREGRGWKQPLTILVATSGDTGSAVAAAFHRRPGFRVVILYPESGVSKRQAHQLGCFGDNILALRVPATFDRCQAMAKEAFSDLALREEVPLSSANSISLGRLLPQAAYYAFAALRHFRATATPLSFIVPTGNLGNGVAALMARGMGLPIHRVLFASNLNATVPEFISSGSYRPRPAISTLANAMDVGNPSNAARLRFMLDADPDLADAIAATSVDDATIRDRIRAGEADYGRVFCPHTACAIEMLERERRRGATETFCVVATAHPAKFEEVVEPLVGHPVAPPPALREMLDRPSSSEPLSAEYGSLKDRLLRL